MDYYETEVNKRIISGNFPTTLLSSASFADDPLVDLEQLAHTGLAVLKDNPELFYLLFSAFRDRMREFISLGKEEYYSHDINILINTRFEPELLTVTSPNYKAASELNPTVTEIDKLCWVGITIYSSVLSLKHVEHRTEMTDMLYAWVYILLICE